MSSKSTRQLQPDAARRVREGSAAGASLVSREFASRVTRKRFCELVGIHPTTLRRWEGDGIVRPRMVTVLGTPTAIFEPADVELGREVRRLLSESPGTMSLRHAAERARRRAGP